MPKIKVTCLNCGKMYKRYPSQLRKRTFCSRNCFYEWWTAHAKGWMIRGYKMVCVNGREIFEHRLVIENHLGRELTANEYVHHINGDITDNCLENLEVMERGEHTTIHNTGKSRKGQKHGPLSEETKLKISLAKRGKSLSKEHKEKIAASMRKTRKNKFWSSKSK